MIPVYKPNIRPYISTATNELAQGWISNHGEYIARAESLLAQICGVRYCILMNNGTSATECLAVALKYKYRIINRIYIPNNVFIAPWSLFYKHFGLEKLRGLDVTLETYNISADLSSLDRLEKNSVLLCVHNLGSVVNVPRIVKARPDLIILEDNCEGFLGLYDGIKTGSNVTTLASSLSFYGNKTITSGEGGAFLTNDEAIYNFIKIYHSHGQGDKRYIHPISGQNFRMTNIQAALLYEQLGDIQNILERKKNLWENYRRLCVESALRGELLKTSPGTEHSYWMFALRLFSGGYQSFEKFMLDRGIEVRPFFYDIRCHEFLRDACVLENIEPTRERGFGVLLPSYPDLTLADQIYIVSSICEYEFQFNGHHNHHD